MQDLVLKEIRDELVNQKRYTYNKKSIQGHKGNSVPSGMRIHQEENKLYLSIAYHLYYL